MVAYAVYAVYAVYPRLSYEVEGLEPERVVHSTALNIRCASSLC